MKLGQIIVIEGSDGGGKATQSRLLYEYLKKVNNNVMALSFPDYESPSSALIKMYLNGDFGLTPDDVNPKTASVFYASDRYASYCVKWREFHEKPDSVLIFDRYVTSNMVHQAAKLTDTSEKEEYLDWVYNLEYEIMGLPLPDRVIFLNMPPEYAGFLMSERPNKITNGDKKDIHEADPEYLRKCYENAVFVASKYKWDEVKCVSGGKIRTAEDIHHEIKEMLGI
jgi:dTMP kinase